MFTGMRTLYATLLHAVHIDYHNMQYNYNGINMLERRKYV